MENFEKKEHGISLLIERAKKDSKFFHDLVWNTEASLSSLDFLSRSEKAALLAISPEDLIVGLANGFKGGSAAACGGTCGASCGASCGGSCGGSCTVTCAASCPATGVKPEFGQEVINPAELISVGEISLEINKFVGQHYSRYSR
jgi:hypothetical protein